jgi:hypothetical protein
MPSPEASRRNIAGVRKPKGSKHNSTLEREDAERRYRIHWQEKFNDLCDAQYSTAVGVKQFVYRDQKTGQYKVISDPLELEARVKLGEALEIVTRLASPQAQSDVLDRILGKPKNAPQDLNVNVSIDVADVLKQRFLKRKQGK